MKRSNKYIIKIAVIINIVLTILFMAGIIFSVLYFLFNPEIIGDFFGKIASGFINALN